MTSARECLGRLWRIAGERLVDDPSPLADLHLSPRTRAALERAGVDTVGKLASLSETERPKVPHIGPKFLAGSGAN